MVPADKVNVLKKLLAKSQYVVALCGSGMVRETGTQIIKSQERAYEIEQTYGRSPEYLYTDAFFNTRTEKFYEFYRKELLKEIPLTASEYALADLERKGKLKCIISSNVYDLARRAGCQNIVNLYGTITKNRCVKCGKEYDMSYVKNCQKIPYCEACGGLIRPRVLLFGEMIDNKVVTRTLEEIEKADLILLLGTTLRSDVFRTYLKAFEEGNIVVINQEEHYTDQNADLVIHANPKDVLPQVVDYEDTY